LYSYHYWHLCHELGIQVVCVTNHVWRPTGELQDIWTHVMIDICVTNYVFKSCYMSNEPRQPTEGRASRHLNSCHDWHLCHDQNDIGWQIPMWCLIFTLIFPQKSPLLRLISANFYQRNICTNTVDIRWQRPIGCLIFISRFPRILATLPLTVVNGSFAKEPTFAAKLS